MIGNDVAGVANKVVIGSGSNNISCDYTTAGTVTWSGTSDQHLKKDIQDDTLGLNFIRKLRPRTFRWKAPNEYDEDVAGYDEDDDRPRGDGGRVHGLIAQEVKQAMDDLDDGHLFNLGMWSDSDPDSKGGQRLGATAAVLPLINAVKELDARNAALEKENPKLRERIDGIEERLRKAGH